MSASRFGYFPEADKPDTDINASNAPIPQVTSATTEYFARLGKTYGVVGKPYSSRFDINGAEHTSTTPKRIGDAIVTSNSNIHPDLYELKYAPVNEWLNLPEDCGKEEIPFAFSPEDLELDEYRRALIALLESRAKLQSPVETDLVHPRNKHGVNAWIAARRLMAQLSHPKTPPLNAIIENSNLYNVKTSTLLLQDETQVTSDVASSIWVDYVRRALKTLDRTEYLTGDIARDLIVLAYLGVSPEDLFSQEMSALNRERSYPKLYNQMIWCVDNSGLDLKKVREVYRNIFDLFEINNPPNDSVWKLNAGHTKPRYYMDFRRYSCELENEAKVRIEAMLGVTIRDVIQHLPVHIASTAVCVVGSCAQTYLVNKMRNVGRISRGDRELCQSPVAHSHFASNGIISMFLRHAVVIGTRSKLPTDQVEVLNYNKPPEKKLYSKAIRELN